MRAYTRVQAVENKTTRHARPPEHSYRVRPLIYREQFLQMTQNWQSDSEPMLCRRVIRISKWAMANAGLMSDEREIVDLMVARIAKLVEKEGN